MEYEINTHFASTVKVVAALHLARHFAGTALAGTPETDEDYASGCMVDGDSVNVDLDGLAADEADTASNGNTSVRQYTLRDCEVFFEEGENRSVSILPSGTHMRDYLMGFDFGDLDAAEFLSGYGYDDEADLADEADTDVRIWVRPHYYVGQCNAPAAHYLCITDEHGQGQWGDHRIFATHADAQAWIDDICCEIYCTSNGEAGRPDYQITR